MNFDPDLHLGLEEMIRYPLFYRRAGVRMPMQLVMPTLNSIADLQLPMGSVVHYVPEDESVFGIPQDEPILQNVERLIMVEHISALADTRGNPIPIRTPVGQMTRAYHRKYRRTRPLVNFQAAAGNERTVIVQNYALLPHLNRYLNNYFRPFNKWWNIQATVWHRVGEIAKISQRQQYYQLRLPKVLPTLPQLRKAEANATRQSLEPFRSPESLMVLELWKWLGAKRDESVLAKCPDQYIDRMNLIFQEGDQWIVVNLGKFNEWRKTEATPDGTIMPEVFQKRFLRMLMTLMETRTAADPSAPEETLVTPPTPTDAAMEPETAETAVDEDKPLTVKIPTESGRNKNVEVFKGSVKDILPDTDEGLDINFDEIDAQIDKDLKSLEDVSERFERAVAEGKTTSDLTERETNTELAPKVEYVERARSLEDGVVERVNELAEGGLLSAGEYRRFMNIAEAYKKIPNPYNPKETLEQGLAIDPKLLVIKTDRDDNRPKIPDIGSVIDKSMLSDSLAAFDRQYTEQVMPKDILNMVANLQLAGVAVTDYRIETTEDALNHFETHTIQLTPVQGKASTVRFMVPKIRADGTFVAGGVKCRMRKQRGDQKSLIL